MKVLPSKHLLSLSRFAGLRFTSSFCLISSSLNVIDSLVLFVQCMIPSIFYNPLIFNYQNQKSEKMKNRRISWILWAFIGLLSVTIVSCEKDDEGVPTEFKLPALYVSGGNLSGPTFADVPAGKKVKVYLLTLASRDNMKPTDVNASFSADLQFNGTTTKGGTNINFQIPENYDGVNLYPFVIIILDEALNDADLTGKNHVGFFSLAPQEGQIVMGVINGNPLPEAFNASVDGGEVILTLIDLKVASYSALAPADN